VVVGLVGILVSSFTCLIHIYIEFYYKVLVMPMPG
jgi:hypothetical protein